MFGRDAFTDKNRLFMVVSKRFLFGYTEGAIHGSIFRLIIYGVHLYIWQSLCIFVTSNKNGW